MKILLVVPRFTLDLNRNYSFPIGMAYISAALKQAGFYVEVLNLNQMAGDVNELISSAIKRFGIDVVLSGGLSQHYKLLKEIFSSARQTNPNIILIGGGGGYTSEPIIFSELTQVDFAVLGEGEVTTCELLRGILQGAAFSQIEGIVYKQNGTYIKTKDRPSIEDIDSIPFPDYDAFGMEEFLEKQYTNDIYFLYKDDKPRNFSMIMGRSCLYQCNFCFHPLGNKYRQRSLDNFFKELDLIVDKYNINSLSIFDELFSSNEERIYEFCERIKKYNLKWIVQMRVDIITDEILKAMKSAGCYYISYGLESFNEQVLKNMRKHISKQQIEKALELTYQNEIGMQGNFIFGDEKESWETFNETLQWWEQNRKYQINLNFIIPFPGTELYKNAVKNNKIADRAQYIRENCPVINLTQESDEDFSKMQEIVKAKKAYNPIRGEVIDLIKQDEPYVYTLVMKCYHCGKITTVKNVYVDQKANDLSNFKMGCRECNRKSSYNLYEKDSFCN